MKDSLQEETDEKNVEPAVNVVGPLPSPPLSDQVPVPLLLLFPERIWEVMPFPGSRCTANVILTRGVEEWSFCLTVGKLWVLVTLQTGCGIRLQLAS